MTRQVCPGCHENAPNVLNPGSLCDECVGRYGHDECERQVALAGYEIMQDGTRRSLYNGGHRGYNEVPCPCGQHYDLDRNGRCLACRVGASDDRGFWRSVAIEARVDERDDAANARAEEEEEREREEEEWLYEQALVATEGERCPPF